MNPFLLRLKLLVFNLKKKLYILASHQFHIEKEIGKEISIKSCQIQSFPLSANSIKVISINCNETVFFRECAYHSTFDSYLCSHINQFYILAQQGISRTNFSQEIPIETTFSNIEIELLKEFIKQKVKDEKNFYIKFKNCDFILRHYGFNIWMESTYIPIEAINKMGLEGVPHDCYRILPFFLTYISSIVNTYRINQYIHIGGFETYNAVRSIASYKIAQLFDLDHLLTSSEIVKLKVDNNEEIGIISPQAIGERAYDIKYEITPSLQKDLISLNLLDCLCFQKDHWVNNYNVAINENNEATTVCAFDNDNIWTFFPNPQVSFKAKFSDAPFIKNGKVQRPYLSKNVVEKFLSISSEELEILVSPYLNKFQLWALKRRFSTIKSALRKLDSDQLLEDNQWSKETINKELMENFGNTYLKLYYNHIRS